MKYIITALITVFSFTALGNETFLADPRHGVDSDEQVLNPEEEVKLFQEQLFKGLDITPLYRFSQTKWYECTDDITGNYINYSCSNRRNISVILNDFMQDHFQQCVNESLPKIGLSPTSNDLHVTHVGIYGDPNHSPRSLHSENRAIDVHELRVFWPNGSSARIVYEDLDNRPFFVAFRQCWGRRVSTYNDCPLYQGQSLLTGSIGWEDSRHRHHMHVSVPYCINGQHAGHYFFR